MQFWSCGNIFRYHLTLHLEFCVHVKVERINKLNATQSGILLHKILAQNEQFSIQIYRFRIQTTVSNEKKLPNQAFIQCVYTSYVCNRIRLNTSAPDIKVFECTCVRVCQCPWNRMEYTISTMCAAGTWIQAIFLHQLCNSIEKSNNNLKSPPHLTPHSSSQHYHKLKSNTLYSLCAHDDFVEVLVYFVILDNSGLLFTFSFQPWIFNNNNNEKKQFTTPNNYYAQLKWKSHWNGSSDIGHLTWWFGGFIVFSIDTFWFHCPIAAATDAVLFFIQQPHHSWIALMIYT